MSDSTVSPAAPAGTPTDAELFPGVYMAIPERMRGAIRRYLHDRIPPGDFLTAVICNDLRNAINRADSENLPLLKLYVQWFYNVAPGNCHGSYAVMQAWLTKKENDE
jgi:hypothetical protein